MVCPFPDPSAILQTVIESSVAIGSVIQQSDRERRSSLHNQVVKALSGLANVDEASGSNISVLSGFSIPKLVLQIVTVDALFRVTSPSVSEFVILKETAFTVYSKARRVSFSPHTAKPVSTKVCSKSVKMLVQFETPVGFALFKVLNEGKLSEVQDLSLDFSTADTAQEQHNRLHADSSQRSIPQIT